MDKAIDFYFDENYGKLYEKVENGKAQIYEYEDENGKISNQFLVRKIGYVEDGKEYFDIVTPYGYGGPVVHYSNNKEKLLENYEREFTNYCYQNNIVSEFVRFHPIIKNYEDFAKINNAQYMRKTLITKLDEEDPIKNQFSKSAKKKVRKAIREGVTYDVIKAPDNIDSFKKVYYDTMDRNHAIDYYYFSDEYFNDILKYFKNNLIYIEVKKDEKVISAGLFFTYKDIIHVHLSGTLTDYLSLSPSCLLNYAITEWGIDNGYRLIHHGGGTSNSSDNSLYLFKKNFCMLYDTDFYIGKRIWNQEIYNKLCDMKGISREEAFFPAYRKP